MPNQKFITIRVPPLTESGGLLDDREQIGIDLRDDPCSHKGINLSALVADYDYILGCWLTVPLDRKLPTGAEACLVRSQKERHGCDLLYRAHAIEG